jgi:hypothetical protein
MEEKKNEKAEIEKLEITPLSDEDLDSVAGGAADDSCSCPGIGCTGNSELA